MGLPIGSSILMSSKHGAIRLGLAIWAYRPWVGQFYPSRTPEREFLPCYGRQLRAVETNATFYAIPREATLVRWRNCVPSGFHFCPKFPQTISHQGALLPHLPAAVAFVERLQQHLGPCLGPLFLQLPPSYDPQRWADLTHFLPALRDRVGAQLALEVRHPAWFAGDPSQQLQNFLRGQAIARVILDTRPIYRCPDDPQLASERRKPDLPLEPSLTADFTIVRYISHPEAPRNQPYWDEWRDRLAPWQLAGKTVYFFVHCPNETQSPQNLRALCDRLQQRGVAADFSPWQAPPQASQQLSLFD